MTSDAGGDAKPRHGRRDRRRTELREASSSTGGGVTGGVIGVR